MENSNIAQIKKSIQNADVVSFDIFDTLIVRLTARAEDVFTIVEHITGIEGFANQREVMQTECSVMVEKTRNEPHATFDDIYDYMEKNSDLKLGDYTWSQLKNIEFQVEKDVLVQNTPMFEVYNFAKKLGKKVILTSDMYLGKKEILPILENCGYKDFDAVYISADVKKTKYRTDLFNYVLKTENIPAEKILHIGDNYEHDVVNSAKCGFKSEHYKGNRNKEKLNLYRSVSAGVSCYIKNCEENFWYNLGADIGGPLYCGFIDKIAECLKKVKPDKLFFLARDGYNLFHIFREMNLIEIDCEYMYASRRAMLLCGINDIDDSAREILPPYTFGQTVKEILDYLDLGNIREETVKKCGFSGFNDIIRNLKDIEKFKDIFNIEKDTLIKRADEEREAFNNYLEKIGFLNCNSLVFDCGWNGSSQYLLDRALSLMNYKGKDSFIYVGLMNSDKCKKQLKGKKYEAMLFDINKNNMLYKRLGRSIVLLELFFGAPHGSVWKYSNNEKGFIEENIENNYEYKNEILRGIIDFIKIAYPIMKKFNICASAEDCLANVYRLIEKPTVQEATEIGNLENVDGFAASSNHKKYIAKLTPEDIKNNPNELYWPQGIYARTDIDEKVKKYVKDKTGIDIKSEENDKSIVKRSNVIQRVIGYMKEYGTMTTAYLIKEKITKGKSKTPYELFIEEKEKDILKTEELSYKPLISFVVPVYNVLEYQLRECIESILNQTYDNFELILVDDKSTWESVPVVLAEYENNSKITVIYRKENGHISRSTNTGIEAAKGEYIAFTDCDDVVAPNAVYEITKMLNKDKSFDFIYSDEDKLTEDSKKRHSPFFKPDWSPDTFMSYMYTNHLAVYRKSIVNEIGGLRIGYEGSQDYDFTMRFVEKTNKIGHIPKVLYHWRQRPESVASDMKSKPYVMKVMRNLKKETLERRNLEGKIICNDEVSQYRVVYTPKDNPLVSIIIPSKDNYEVLERCILSIVNKTEYKNYEIIVIDNGSDDINREKYSDLCKKINGIYHYEKMPFNFSKMCNIGAEISNGEYLLFLNDDTEVIEGGWLESMTGQAGLNYAGAVGAKLLYPDSTIIQHCGVINLPMGPCHAFAGMDDSVPLYFSRNKVDYNYLAVTAACLCIHKNKFNEVNGFDENLTIAYNDIDLCFKLYEKGYYNSIRNDAVLYHYESLSRGIDDDDSEKMKRLISERKRLYDKHKNLKNFDPFYNVNLAKNRVDFKIDSSVYLKPNKCVKKNKNVMSLINNRVKGFIDVVNVNEIIEISGWAFIAAMPLNNLNRKYLVLIDENNKANIFKTNVMLRFDVTKAFGKKGNLNMAGFSCNIKYDNLEKGRYRIGILVENPYMLKKYVTLFDRYINII